MLGPLIDKLECVEDKLMKIKNEESKVESCSTNERFRNLTNTVNILSALVYKSTQNKNYEDDIASCHGKSVNPLPNLCSSEEFLNEVKNLLLSKPEFNGDIHSYLSNVQRLMGDLVFSICEISNSKMQLASGIKVKDLLRIKNVYYNLGELLSSSFHPTSLNQKNITTQIEQTEKNPPEMNSFVIDLVNATESCLKEMSKVKLDIEHYIKYNMIEVQFTKTKDTADDSESNIPDENRKKKSEIYFKSEDYAINTQSSSECFPHVFSECEHVSQTALFDLSPAQSGTQENYMESCMFPQNIPGWDNCYENYTIVQEPYGNIFNGQIIYPPEVLFFEPPTVVFQSQMEPTRKNSLPKIYSVNSINDNTKKLSRDNIGGIKEPKKDLPKDYANTKGNSIKELLLENMDEDIFFDNPNNNKNESEYVQLREKISSLVCLLKTKQMSNLDDIFEINPSTREAGHPSPLHKQNGKSTKTRNKKKSVKGKHLSNNMTNLPLQQTNQEKQKPNVIRKNRQLFDQNQSKKTEYTGLLTQEHRKFMECPIEFWVPPEKEILYDRQSVIELFKSKPKEYCNTDSVPTEESSFCLWPVMADYIYVSKSDGLKNCHSVPSGNSTLGKGLEKSFYTLQMNKEYEQNHFYDGDIIVLNPSETKVYNKTISTYSLINSQNISHNGHEVIKNNVKTLHPLNCNHQPMFQNKQNLFFNNSLVPNKLKAQQRTYAVHYADCADSFIMGNNFKKEKINFFNFNSYEESHNWDSFISIMTSKVGPQTQINEQRMFRKIVKNMGAESLHNNIFGNVHTLTSSGGPFRLFDINGYPLTDSEGNVLKDPYGKCLVQLDSTGLPKEDIKIFDATGNSPKDVKFDPTQKPQTNCVVLRLTDNFKRPLHLFDKYDRPLTDSGGKLLVNIHGRPLLRFDSFGRPNTDYRGGPLYTDNGFKWSFKAQSHSKEHISDENLITQKNDFKNESERDTSICADTIPDEKPKSFSDSCSSDQTTLDKFANSNSRNSEIWQKVENVLLQHSRKTKLEVKTSKSEELVNNCPVGVNQKLADRNYLDSIIYHTAETRYATHNLNSENYQEVRINVKEDDDRVKEGYYECNFLDTKMDCGLKKDVFNVTMNANMPMQFYDKYLTNKKFQSVQDHCTPNIFLGTENVSRDPRFFINGNIMRKSPLMNTSPHHQQDITNIVPSIFSFKKHHYLNNLCNQILKNNLESTIIQKDNILRDNNVRLKYGGEKNNLTGTTLSDFTSSYVSKYTNDIPLFTDSPAISSDSDKRDPQITKILEDIDLKFRKHSNIKLKTKRNNDSRNQENVKDTIKGGKFVNQNEKKLKDQRYNEYHEEITKSVTSDETTTYIDIMNNRSNQYQINVKERMRTGFQLHEESKIVNQESHCELLSICKPPQHETDYPERENGSQETKQRVTLPQTQNVCTRPTNYPAAVYHGQYCRHFKHEKSKHSVSPFRFRSDVEMENSMNSKIDYVDGKNWLGSNLNKSNQILEKRKNNELINHDHSAHKNNHGYPKIDKKPQRNGRDCNLVSFLGTPVKYVWNKLDNKLSMRQTLKEKQYKQLNTIYESNERKVQTLFTKGNEKYLASTESCFEFKRGKKRRKKGETLLALKSKSFSDITGGKEKYMSYSGSQDTTGKHSPESSSQYKCSSDTVVMSSHKHAYPQRKSRKCDMKKPKKEKYSFESHYVNTTNNCHSRSDKSPCGYNKHISKSPKSTKPGKSGRFSKQKKVR